MNPFNGQLLLALLCVAVAAAVLVRRFVLMIRNPGKSGCGSGSCGGCPSKTTTQTDGFVSLEQFTDSEHK